MWIKNDFHSSCTRTVQSLKKNLEAGNAEKSLFLHCKVKLLKQNFKF